MFLKLLATVSREGQIGPQVVHVARRGSGTRVIALSAKHPDIMISVWLPYGCPAAPAGQVVHKRYAVGKIRAVFVDVAGALPPNPLSAALLVFPNIVKESGRLRDFGAVSPAAEEPQVIGSIRPTHWSPPRPRNIPCRRCRLGAIDAILICRISARDPSPLAAGTVVLPKVVEQPNGAARVYALAAK